MIAAREQIKLRKEQGWADVDELVNWLNPEDPTLNLVKRDSLARYVGYWHDNTIRGYFALPCLVCDHQDHFVALRNLVRDPARYGWGVQDPRYTLVNNINQFFEEYLLPSNLLVADHLGI